MTDRILHGQEYPFKKKKKIVDSLLHGSTSVTNIYNERGLTLIGGSLEGYRERQNGVISL